jgi:hypothetical protein
MCLFFLSEASGKRRPFFIFVRVLVKRFFSYCPLLSILLNKVKLHASPFFSFNDIFSSITNSIVSIKKTPILHGDHHQFTKERYKDVKFSLRLNFFEIKFLEKRFNLIERKVFNKNHPSFNEKKSYFPSQIIEKLLITFFFNE